MLGQERLTGHYESWYTDGKQSALVSFLNTVTKYLIEATEKGIYFS